MAHLTPRSQARPPRGAALVISLIILTLWLNPTAQAEDPASDHAEMLQELLKEAEEIDDKVGQIRGLAPLGPIKKGIKNRDDLAAMLKQRLEEEIKPEDLRRETAVLVRMGLLEPGFDYGAFLLALLTEQIAGFYDNKTRELVIIDSEPDMTTQRVVMAHELFHAIQDQHFTIESLQPPARGLVGTEGNEDRTLARSALIEGDATALMLDFTYHEMGALAYGSGSSLLDNPMASQILAQLTGNMDPTMLGQSPVLASAPAWIQELLIFPYIQGLLFVAEMRAGNASWDRLNAVYLDPPNSTEQILHPERYITRDAPALVVLDDDALAAALGKGAESIYQNAQGELRLRLWLAHHMDDKALSKAAPGLTIERAAEGWGGDRLYGFEVEGEPVIVGATVWDTARDALEFEAAFGAMMALRFPEANHERDKGEQGANHCFEQGEQRHYVERWGKWVIYAEGLPKGVDLDEIRAAIWDTRRVGDYPRTKTLGPLGAEAP